MKIFKKRGQQQVGMTLIELLIVVILLLILVAVIWLIFFAGTGAIEEQASVTGYTSLINTTKDMLKSPAQVEKATMILSISEDATIVGFNKNESFVKDACDPNENVQKPAKCGKDACLCYYNPGYYEDFENNQLSKTEECIRFPDVDYFISFYYVDWAKKDQYGVNPEIYKNLVGDRILIDFPSYYPSERYSYLFMYGECDGWSWDAEFGKQMIYLEKVKDPATKKTYILIAKDVDKDYLTSRYDILKTNIKKPAEQYLSDLKDYFDKKDYAKAKESAEIFRYYYPDHANITVVEDYLDKIEEEEKRIAEEAEKRLQEYEEGIAESSPPGYPPDYTS